MSATLGAKPDNCARLVPQQSEIGILIGVNSHSHMEASGRCYEVNVAGRKQKFIES
jgi:hypothetical protein